jgi:hypothetical protein
MTDESKFKHFHMNPDQEPIPDFWEREKPWVVLTDEEVFETFGNFSTMTGKSWLDLYRMAEAKLKEKNT